ncbi:acireductone synthase [Actinoplanes sp. NPDC051411]|uniref:acireductone synthase n=1 Tax=Actinoplanes sp. NPDC051411 TaxID=3155522 RepID=UPI0034228A84
MTLSGVACVVLDIEGTTSATRFVTDVLYPYSRRRFADLLSGRAGEPAVRRAVDQIRGLLDDPEADAATMERALHAWLDADTKVTPLKTLQGIIWAEGFTRGELTSHFFPDVLPALRAWHAGGIRLCVYSSGSVAAQRAWFAHTPEGDLTPLLDGLFDTENAGPKTLPASYRTITAAIAVPPDRTLFLSDRLSELEAARSAGWLTTGIRRLGEPYHAQGSGSHPEALTFSSIALTRQGVAS